MGEHVAFIMKCELKRDTPEQVIDTLKYMTTPTALNQEYPNHPEHPFFEEDRWENTLWFGGGEIWDPKSTFTLNEGGPVYTLNVRTSIKWGDEQIRLFLHWLVPYSKTGGIVGYIHPEYDRRPSRILFEDGKAYILEPVENAEGLDELVEVDREGRMRAMLESMERIMPGMAQYIEEQLQNQPDDELTPDFIQKELEFEEEPPK